MNKPLPIVETINKIRRLPLRLQISMNILKYWIYLEKVPKDQHSNLCLAISNTLAEENEQWLASLCDNNNIDKTIINFNNPCCIMRKI